MINKAIMHHPAARRLRGILGIGLGALLIWHCAEGTLPSLPIFLVAGLVVAWMIAARTRRVS